MTRDAALAHLETYLIQVRRYLRGISEAEADEILAELHSHVLDRVEGVLTPNTVEAALHALGSAREVAQINVASRVAADMDRDSPPLGVVRAVIRMAKVSGMGLVTFFMTLFGYALAVGFLAVAVWKPIDPSHVGLWRVPDPNNPFNYSMGVREAVPGMQELLGWWIIPVSVTLAVTVGYLTWRLGAACIRAMAQPRRLTA